MKKTTFTCSLAGAMNDFVALKRAEGHKYEDGAYELSNFDRFLHDQQFDEAILSKDVLGDYQTTLLPLSANSRYKKMVATRDFTRHYQQINPRSAILVTYPVKRPKPLNPYIYTPGDISNLIQEAAALGPAQTIKPDTFRVLIGLLYATGMRISEALNLTIKDIHQQPNRLFISDTKFGKDRWLVLRDSTASALMSYMAVRKQFAPMKPDDPFFLNQKGTALCYYTAWEGFKALLTKCDIGSNWQGSSPRLHGLRHTFVVNCLIQCDRQGIDPNLQLPKLVTYLGHQSLVGTSVYLHTTPALMDRASQRFHDYFQPMTPRQEADND